MEAVPQSMNHIGCKLSIWVAMQVSPKKVQFKRGGAMATPGGWGIELVRPKGH